MNPKGRGESFGWRTAILDSAGEVTLQDGCIAVKGERELSLPLSQFGTLVSGDQVLTMQCLPMMFC